MGSASGPSSLFLPVNLQQSIDGCQAVIFLTSLDVSLGAKLYTAVLLCELLFQTLHHNLTQSVMNGEMKSWYMMTHSQFGGASVCSHGLSEASNWPGQCLPTTATNKKYCEILPCTVVSICFKGREEKRTTNSCRLNIALRSKLFLRN